MNYTKRNKLRDLFDEDPTKPYLREFRLEGINCVSVSNKNGVKGFFVGVSEDYIEGIIEDCDLIPTAQRLKQIINSNKDN